MHFTTSSHRPRRATIFVLSALAVTALVVVLAFGVDVAVLVLARTQLQLAADSAALAAAAGMDLPQAEMTAIAQQNAGYHTASGRQVQLLPEDVEYGTWESQSRRFKLSLSPSNAVRITARRDAVMGGGVPLFFGRVFGRTTQDAMVSAVAAVNPRDIALVVDLSGAMNDGAEPLGGSVATARNPEADESLRQLFADFGYGDYPGRLEHVGQPLGIGPRADAYAEMTRTDGPLGQESVPAPYRIRAGDDEAQRKRKAWSWVIDHQLRPLVPKARPLPDSRNAYGYWKEYLERHRQVGYQTYVQFMLDQGRDLKPDGVHYVSLSCYSPDCPWHSEATAGGTFRFPPREQPLHGVRRALIAAIEAVKQRNQGIPLRNQRDWVAVISFDTLTGGGPVLEQSLTDDYQAAMLACTRLQAVGEKDASRATEAGLIAAQKHINSEREGGLGRVSASKIVILLTQGPPNLYASDKSAVRNYLRSHPNSDWYAKGQECQNAALMQASMIRSRKWQLFPVGVGPGADYGFLDRLARLGGTADEDGHSPRGDNDPARSEHRLSEILQQIIDHPQVRLVQ